MRLTVCCCFLLFSVLFLFLLIPQKAQKKIRHHFKFRLSAMVGPYQSSRHPWLFTVRPLGDGLFVTYVVIKWRKHIWIAQTTPVFITILPTFGELQRLKTFSESVLKANRTSLGLQSHSHKKLSYLILQFYLLKCFSQPLER